MKSRYSIISAAIRPEIGERITIGLLLIDEEKVYFRFSKDKLNVLKELINDHSYVYLKESIKQIRQAAISEASKLASLFTYNEIQNPLFSAGYLEYLSRYSNNLLNFTSPKNIEVKADETLFLNLYKKYVDDSVFVTEPEMINRFELIKNEFLPRVEKYYNLEQKLTPEDIYDLPISIKVDMIGKNERVVYAQMIELERIQYHIQNDLGLLALLNQAYKNDAVGFVVSSEPEKIRYPKQHEVWENLRSNNLAKYVDLSEIDQIEEYALKHGVQPLIKALSN